MKRDWASELRAIADGRLMLNVRNGVTVSRSMLAMIADELDATTTRLAEVEKALEPFARLPEFVDRNNWDDVAVVHFKNGSSVLNTVSLGDLRAARALKENGNG